MGDRYSQYGLYFCSVCLEELYLDDLVMHRPPASLICKPCVEKSKLKLGLAELIMEVANG